MSSLFSTFLQVSKVPTKMLFFSQYFSLFPNLYAICFLVYKENKNNSLSNIIFSHLFSMFHFTALCFSHDICNTIIYIRMSCRFYSRHEVFKLSNSCDSLTFGNFSSLLILYTQLTTECSLACLLQ